MYSPVVVLFAVNIPVPRKTRDLPVQRIPALATLQTGSMPPPVHRLQIEPVRDPHPAPRTHGPVRVVAGGAARRRRRRRPRRLQRFEFRYVVFEGRVRPTANLAGRRLRLVGRGRPARIRTARLVVVVRGGAARTAAGYRRVSVTH